MHSWIEKIVRRVRETPPACLEGFQVTPVLKEPWNHWVTWAVSCTCGTDTGRLKGYPLKDYNSEYDGPELFLSPLAFECTSCNKTTEIIDTKLHGYDSECDKLQGKPTLDANSRGSGMPKIFACPHCGETGFQLQVQCAHPHFDLIEDSPELEPRTQDFFDAFGVRATCKVCGTESNPASYELA